MSDVCVVVSVLPTLLDLPGAVVLHACIGNNPVADFDKVTNVDLGHYIPSLLRVERD